MRSKSRELMEQIHDYAEQFYFDRGRSPSTTEIGDAVGIARGTAYKYLVEMSENGMIEYDGCDIITRKRRMTSRISAPSGVFSGAIPCGPLDEVETYVEEYVQLPVSIFGNGELFVLRTKGESMIEADIEEGDIVVVRKQQTANIGDIVVALSNGANTLKRLMYDSGKQGYILHPENPSMEDIEVNELVIQGVAEYVIKKL